MNSECQVTPETMSLIEQYLQIPLMTVCNKEKGVHFVLLITQAARGINLIRYWHYVQSTKVTRSTVHLFVSEN